MTFGTVLFAPLSLLPQPDLGEDQDVEIEKEHTMNSIKTGFIAGIAALALVIPATAEAAPSFRFRASGVNPNTGNGARVAGGFNSQTGARFVRGGGYNASTQTFQSGTRAYNPSTGQGFTSNTTAARGSGITTTVNTVNNGSYSCSVSQALPANCTETSF